MNDLASGGRVVVAACDETELSYDGTSSMQNGVFTYYYMEKLYQYDVVETAFGSAAPLAGGDAGNNPKMYDGYEGNWDYGAT